MQETDSVAHLPDCGGGGGACVVTGGGGACVVTGGGGGCCVVTGGGDGGIGGGV